MKKYLKKNEIAVFYYQGGHSHPVKRVVVVVKSSPTHITGYEVREGFNIRETSKAPIKTYLKENIATVRQLRNDNKLRRNRKNWNKSTLIRINSLKALSII
jgi:hypothetical protein